MRKIYIAGIVILSVLLLVMLYFSTMNSSQHNEIGFNEDDWQERLAELDRSNIGVNDDDDVTLGAPNSPDSPAEDMIVTSRNELLATLKEHQCPQVKSASILNFETLIGIISTLAGIISLLFALKQERRAMKGSEI